MEVVRPGQVFDVFDDVGCEAQLLIFWNQTHIVDVPAVQRVTQRFSSTVYFLHFSFTKRMTPQITLRIVSKHQPKPTQSIDAIFKLTTGSSSTINKKLPWGYR